MLDEILRKKREILIIMLRGKEYMIRISLAWFKILNSQLLSCLFSRVLHTYTRGNFHTLIYLRSYEKSQGYNQSVHNLRQKWLNVQSFVRPL